MDKQINFIDLAKFYLHKWWILVLGMIIGGIVSGIFTVFFVTPIYESAGSLYAENSNDMVSKDITDVNLNTIMVRQELVQTYAEVLTSNVFLKRVASESGLDYTHDQLLRMISMSSKNDTEILVVSVKSPNPQHAYIIAQVIVNLAGEQISSVVEGGNVKILDEPEYPQTFSSPNIVRNIEIGMLAGLLLTMLIIFIFEMLDNKVKDTEHLTESFDYPVLGEIPYFVSTKKGDAIKPKSHRTKKL